MKSGIMRLFLILAFSLSLLGCNREGIQDDNAITLSNADDPVIGVVIESTGETVYTVEDLHAAGIVDTEYAEATRSNIYNSFESGIIPIVSASPAQPEETLRGVMDRESMVAAYSIAVRAAINEAIGDRYDADFGSDVGTITLGEARNADIVGLEKYLEQVAEESGLPGYDIQIVTPIISADIPAPVRLDDPGQTPTSEPIPTPEPTLESIPSAVPTAVPSPTPEPVPIVAQVANNQGKTITLPPGTLVWKTRTGEKFHNKQKCGNSNPDTTVQITVEDAVNQYNLEACDTCYQGQY